MTAASNSPAGNLETIASVGENESLRRTISRLNKGDWELVGPGDDSAVIRAEHGSFVVTTDTLVQDHDFRLDWSTWFDLGWKAIASNLSDVAAMGARPTVLVVAVVCPTSTLVADLEAFADGLREACLSLSPGTAVVGGDLASGSQVVISVTAHGDLEGRAPVVRTGANPGDILAVAGTLGQAACGLDLLASGNTDAVSAWDEWVSVQRRPQPPLAAGIAAAEAGATSMLDISDGLAKDASRIAKASGVTVQIQSAALFGFEARLEGAAQSLSLANPHLIEMGEPNLAAEQYCRKWVLTGGEDHSLLATFPAGTVLPRGFKSIGVILEAQADRPLLLDDAPINPDGWDSVTG
ncbi:MAG: thiamine-phosphate kinase [Actinomycetales bacterium]|nr:thiamine-phosphate kinase [Actinomycetales bacterium]